MQIAGTATFCDCTIYGDGIPVAVHDDGVGQREEEIYPDHYCHEDAPLLKGALTQGSRTQDHVLA